MQIPGICYRKFLGIVLIAENQGFGLSAAFAL